MDEQPKSREEVLAAIKAKADAIRAQRAAAPANTQLRVYGSVNFAVEIVGEKSEEENLRKLLGGIGAYQNPVRGGSFTVDYRYYAEAKRRLEHGGYTIGEDQFGPVKPGER